MTEDPYDNGIKVEGKAILKQGPAWQTICIYPVQDTVKVILCSEERSRILQNKAEEWELSLSSSSHFQILYNSQKWSSNTKT